MTQTEAIKLAIEWIEKQPEEITASKYDVNSRYVVLRDLEAALAQPEQEPVAVVDVHEFYDNCANFSLLQKLPKGKHTLYTAPPQRTWVGLTDEDEIDWEEGGNLKDLVKAIEAKLKEKNNG